VTSSVRRIIVATVAIGCSLGVLPLVGSSSAASPNPLADPPANVAPSDAFLNACNGMTTSKAANDSCDAAARKDFDAVRAAEGLGPMTLPGDFDTLAVPAQLLAISNIERVDRGLRPVTGMSSSLDSLAQDGANNDDDPPFPNPFDGTYGGGNWAGAGNSALLDDFYWMYDDGLGSFNGDCTQADQSGCWGHRHVILHDYDAPLVMGAAVAYQTTWGTSMAEEFIGHDTSDQADVEPTWAQIAATLPVKVSATTLTVSADTGKTAHRTVTVSAATHQTVDINVTAGSKSWSVSPDSCTLAAGGTCTLHLTFDPASSGRHDGTMTITAANGTRTVRLVGSQAAPRLAIAASQTRVRAGQGTTITGTVTAHIARTPVTGQLVQLDRRRGSGGWKPLLTKRSGPHGQVRFRRHPVSTTTYRLKALGSNDASEGASSRIRIAVG
jgi:hypothetical protein